MVADETAGYAHATEISRAGADRAPPTPSALAARLSGTAAERRARTNGKLYGDENPLGLPAFESKVELLQRSTPMPAAKRPARGAGLGLASAASGRRSRSCAPTARAARRAPAGAAQCLGRGRRGRPPETGTSGAGGRAGYGDYIEPETLAATQVDEALRQALVNLDAVPAPAGEMDVVLGPGWNGVLLHEAVGHGLEGDFNRKGTSAFSGRIGERVARRASPCSTTAPSPAAAAR